MTWVVARSEVPAVILSKAPAVILSKAPAVILSEETACVPLREGSNGHKSDSSQERLRMN